MKILFLNVVLLLATNLIAMDGERARKQKWDGEQYQKNSSSQTNFAIPFLKQLKVETGKFKSICDMGCGTGDITLSISLMSPESKVIGCDPSPKQLEVAQRKEKRNLNFIQVAAEDVSCECEYDLYTSFSAWHWIEKQRQAIESAARSLQNGGTLFITMIGKTDNASDIEQAYNLPLMRALLKVSKSIAWSETFKGVDFSKEVFPLHQDEMKEMMESAGLNVQTINCNLIKISYKSAEIFRDAFKAFLGGCPSIAALDPLNFGCFMEDVLQGYLEEAPANDDGSIEYEIQVLIAHAVKPANS